MQPGDPVNVARKPHFVYMAHDVTNTGGLLLSEMRRWKNAVEPGGGAVSGENLKVMDLRTELFLLVRGLNVGARDILEVLPPSVVFSLVEIHVLEMIGHYNKDISLQRANCLITAWGGMSGGNEGAAAVAAAEGAAEGRGEEDEETRRTARATWPGRAALAERHQNDPLAFNVNNNGGLDLIPGGPRRESLIREIAEGSLLRESIILGAEPNRFIHPPPAEG